MYFSDFNRQICLENFFPSKCDSQYLKKKRYNKKLGKLRSGFGCEKSWGIFLNLLLTYVWPSPSYLTFQFFVFSIWPTLFSSLAGTLWSLINFVNHFDFHSWRMLEKCRLLLLLFTIYYSLSRLSSSLCRLTPEPRRQINNKCSVSPSANIRMAQQWEIVF